MSPLMKSIDEFYKYYQEKIKIKSEKNNQVPYFIKKGIMKKLILSFIIGVFTIFSSHADEELLQGSMKQVPTVCVSNEIIYKIRKEKRRSTTQC